MDKKTEKIKTRFAPSPTGHLHIGNVRTALFNYFFAKKNDGEFIIRVEDTDKVRSKKEYEEDMLKSLNWLGVEYGGDIWHQSKRKEKYKEYLNRLIEDNKAYISQETEGENKEVIRFKNPNKSVVFEDLIRGEVKFDTTELGNFIIARNINEPVYHLAVVIDDFESGISHVIRGEDHISNTPRQILIAEAIGAPLPTYAHLPLILGSDRSKLSKRKHGEFVSLNYYTKQGYLSEAIVNYLALLGWNPGGDEEIFTMQEIIKNFDISKVQKGGAIFNEERLQWINKEHLKKISSDGDIDEFKRRLERQGYDPNHLTKEILIKLWNEVRERISFYGEIDKMIEDGELDYYFEKPKLENDKLVWKKSTPEKTARHLDYLKETLEKIPDKSYNKDNVKNSIWEYAEKEGRGDVLWPLRYALSGKEKSPDPFTISEILGRKESIKRIENARKNIKD